MLFFSRNDRESGAARYLLAVAALIVGVALIYVKVTGAYFCSYDDFLEVHRAAFEDTQDPSKIITTPHFYTYKYRPFNRGINYITYRIGGQNPEFFRVRNLAFHLLNIVLVYLLAWKLFGSLRISLVAAALFGLHPLANQSVIGSVMTNTMAHAAFLAALLMVMRSAESGRYRWVWLAAGAVSGWISLMAYDPNIVVFGLMLAWILAKRFAAREDIPLRATGLFICFSAILVGIYFGLRELYVPRGWTRAAASVPAFGSILKNALMYGGAMVSPVDVVLANDWVRAPLPPEFTAHIFWVAGYGVLIMLTGLAVIVLLLRWLKTSDSPKDYLALAIILLGMTLPLSTLLLFQSHPSETYLYLPVAFYAILLSCSLGKGLRRLDGRSFAYVYAVVVVLLIFLFASATWARNNRVAQCGETAHRILTHLPKELSTGRWEVLFANNPGEETTDRYGFYGFRGIHTVSHHDNRAISSALQLLYHNALVTGKIVEARELLTNCGHEANQLCVLTHADGRLKYWSSDPKLRRARPVGSVKTLKPKF